MFRHQNEPPVQLVYHYRRFLAKKHRFEALFSAQKVGKKRVTSPRVEALLKYRMQRDANICDRG